MLPVLATSLPDYSALSPYVIAVGVLLGVTGVVLFVRFAKHYPTWARRILWVVLAWVVVSVIVAIVVRVCS